MRCLSIAATAALIAVFAVACGGSSSEDDFPELTPFPASMAERLHEIRDKVADIRGLPINEEAEEGLVTTEALQEYGRGQYAALEEEDEADVEAGEATLELLGLVPPGFSFEEDYSDQSTELIAGLYYFEEDRLVLVGEATDDLTVSEELTLAHEYTHSLQDAHYDLEEYFTMWTESQLEEDGYSSYSETLSCLIEGDAELTQRLYAEEEIGEDWREQAAADYADDPPSFDLPDFLLRATYFNYTDCVAFVEQLYEDGGWDAVNAAYDDPPATTEQVLHPEKYHSGELARTPKPESLAQDVDGWTELSGGQFGEYDVYNYVLTLSDDIFAALTGAEGWGAGWVSVYRDEDDPSRVAVHISLDWDTPEDYGEFLLAFGGVLESYGVAPENVAVADVLRWTAEADFDQFGAALLNEDLLRVEMIFSGDEDGRETFVAEL